VGVQVGLGEWVCVGVTRMGCQYQLLECLRIWIVYSSCNSCLPSPPPPHTLSP
jgi:hypothetical protein